MPIPIITRTNTIDEWRVQTNQAASSLNNLETSTFEKSNGSLTISGNSSVIITANGTSLQVSNSALFQSNVTVGGDMGIGVESTATGNVTMGGVLVVRGPGTAFQVANNALVNNNLQVTQRITTNNITANSNVTVGGNQSIGGILTLTRTGHALFANSGYSSFDRSTINTATIGRGTVTNADIEFANVTSKLDVQSGLVTISATSGTDDALTVTLGDTVLQTTIIEGDLVVEGTFTQTGNLNFEIDTFNLNANTGTNKNAFIRNTRPSGNDAIIQWNESSKYWQISQGNTYSQLNNIIDASFVLANVTSNSVTNVGSASAVKAAFDTATFAGGYANSAFSAANTADQRAVTSGSYANSAFGAANTADQRAVTSGVYANSAYIHANASFNQSNTRFASTGGTISGDVAITGNLTVTGQTTYANTTTVNLGDNIITLNADIPQASAPSENAGIEVDRGSSANVQVLWNESTDRWTFTNDGSSYADIAGVFQVTAAGTYANTAYLHANSAFVSQNTTGVYANSAYNQANTATTNAATADQRAVTSGSYANSAYLQANTATTNAASANTNANSRVLKSGDTMTGALIVQSTIDATGNITAPLFSGTATAARYADLAEKYTTDIEYSIGTVVVVNPEPDSEATKSTSISQLVLGVISEKPAYLMNSESTGQAIALRGRVPVRVIGPVRKGQTLVSGPDGTASVGEVNRFAIALESKDTHEEGNIEVVIL